MDFIVLHLLSQDENSLTSYDGRKYIFEKNISPVEITNKCLNLISSMSMGSNEYSEEHIKIIIEEKVKIVFTVEVCDTLATLSCSSHCNNIVN